MLIRYFLQAFFSRSFLFFVILTGIFASCDLFLRLPLIGSAWTIPVVFILMLPLMAIFSLPIATSLAVFATVAAHKVQDQLLFLSYSKKALRALLASVGLFSLITCLVYAFLAFKLVPESYHKGKQLLVKAAQEHLLKLEPNKFHTPFPAFTVFFKTRNYAKANSPQFSTLFLVYSPNKKQHEEQYFFTAEKGSFCDNKLTLYNGAIHTFKQGHFHAATFAQTDIDFDAFIRENVGIVSLSNFKFWTWDKLFSQAHADSQACVELHKRIVQSLWQLLLPMVAFVWAWVMPYVTLLSGLALCGSLYLSSYVLIALAQSYYQRVGFALALLYIPLIVMLLAMLFLFRRKKF